jgi:hypothetical protein
VQGVEDGYMPPPLCVRDGDWKLFVNHHGKNPQLFHITEDPGEHHDLAAQKPELVSALTEKALGWVKTLPPSPAREKVMAGNSPLPKGGGLAPAQKIREPQNRPRIFAKWDKDGDGFLSRDEFIPHIADKTDAPARFLRFDRDGDGRLSKEEFVGEGKPSQDVPGRPR